jgi:hypothetical protein
VCPPAPDPDTVFSGLTASAAAGAAAAGAGAAPKAGGGAGGRAAEDPGGRALTLALLSSIVAAAAPDLVVSEPPPPAPKPAGGPGGKPPLPKAPSPTPALAPAGAAAAAAPQQQQDGGPGAAAAAAAAGASPLGLLRSGMQRLSTGAASAVNSAVSNAATAVNGAVAGAVTGAVSAGSTWVRRSSSSSGGLLDSLRPRDREAAEAAAAAAAEGAGSAGGEGLAAAAASADAGGGAAASAGSGATNTTTTTTSSSSSSSSSMAGGFLPGLFRSSSGAATGTRPAASSSLLGSLTRPLASTAAGGGRGGAAGGAAPQQQPQQHAAPHLLTSASWPRGLPDSLRPLQTLQLQRAPLSAVQLAAAHGSPFAYCVGHGGLLRVLSLPALQANRSAKLPGDLLSLALLHGPQQGAQLHPLLLAGSHAGRVFAYSPEGGKLAGAFDAHEDAVSCMAWLDPAAAQQGQQSQQQGQQQGQQQQAQQQQGEGARQLLTGSWDCGVRLWDLGEGRQPWAGSMALPLAELRDLEAGVWALAVGGAGGPGGPSAVFAATEDGAVACWDVRAGGGGAALRWRAQVSEDYIGGVTLAAGGHYLAVGAADGELSLLDVRAGGGRVAAARCGAALRSCCGDGRLAVAGAEGGVVQLWDLSQMGGGGEPAGFAAPGPDGLYPPLRCPEAAAVNGVAAAAFGAGDDARAYLCAALESGHLSVFGTR